MNTNYGSEQGASHSHPNGTTSTSGASPFARSGQSQTSSSPAEASESGVDQVKQTAQRIGSQMWGSPYSLPIAIGGAAFILGTLASSRILRQLVLLAGVYAVKYAVQNAPKDQIMDYAKNYVKAQFAQPKAA
jgi:hypothetical protein